MESMSVIIQKPIEPTPAPCSPLFSANAAHKLYILHPGYPDSHAVLLTLHAPDARDGGLHYGMVLAAAALVAGNSFNGYLSSTTNGSRVSTAKNAVLKCGSYYFHTGSCCSRGLPLSCSNLDVLRLY